MNNKTEAKFQLAATALLLSLDVGVLHHWLIDSDSFRRVWFIVFGALGVIFAAIFDC